MPHSHLYDVLMQNPTLIAMGVVVGRAGMLMLLASLVFSVLMSFA